MANSFLDLAIEVLKQAPKPLTYQEVWELGKQLGVTTKIKTSGKTPWQSLGAQLYVDVRDNPNSKFIKVGKRPTRFFLKDREKELAGDIVAKIEQEETKKPSKKTFYHERDLHPILAYFAYSNPSFNRGRSIFTKTIFHEKSKKSGYSEWTNPDMVGFYLPLEDWRPEVIEFNRLSDNNSLRLFSFELKKVLDKSNYREAYFQAVSNSSWAHEGYLVATEVLQDDDFLGELERLLYDTACTIQDRWITCSDLKVLLRDAGVTGKSESVYGLRSRTWSRDEILFPYALFPSLDGIFGLLTQDEPRFARVTGTKSVSSASPTHGGLHWQQFLVLT